MNEALLNALIIASGGMLAIGPPLIILIFLSAARGLTKAFSFLGGYFGGYVVIGALSILIGSRVEGGEGAQSVARYLMIFFGALFLFFASKSLRAALRREPPAPSKLAQSLELMSPKKSASIGALISVVNFKNLAIFMTAIGALNELPAALSTRVFLVPVVALVFCSTTAVPIVVRIAFPKRSSGWLVVMRRWLEKNKRTLGIVILTLFGVLFLYKGLA